MNQSPPPAPAGSAAAPSGGPVAALAAAYRVTGPALDLGALLWEGESLPEVPIRIPLALLHRHGLITGGGTERTRTLRLIAERLSAHGVPVLLTDLTGALSGIAAPGTGGERLERRAAELGEEWTGLGFPVQRYAPGGLGTGTPLRTTVADFGPAPLASALGLDAGQQRILERALRQARRAGLPPTGLAQLRAALDGVASGEEGSGEGSASGAGGSGAGGGRLSGMGLAGVLSSLADFERHGGGAFFGASAFDTDRLVGTAEDGRGLVSVLDLSAVRDRPRLCGAFPAWLLTGLCRALPEAGEAPKPALVCCVDEARLLFEGGSPGLREAVALAVRRLGSRAVGVFLAAGAPGEVPAEVRELPAHRVRLASPATAERGAGPAVQGLVRPAPAAPDRPAEPLPAPGPGPGEAVVSALDERGEPTPAAAVRLRVPQSLMSPAEAADLDRAISADRPPPGPAPHRGG
ncbi:hypothetical protein ACZ90_05240 [Streptomyces albus subsp. albus]|nr:hypothetical protein ACZ90_05240 [Streptomyces albus subsp. albus]